MHVIELVKSLPEADQRAIREALAALPLKPEPTARRKLPQLPDGTYYNPEGIANDDPIFEILGKIEADRHGTVARPTPEFK